PDALPIYVLDALALEVRPVHGVVRDREVHVRELLRVRRLGAREQEARRDHELRALAYRSVEVRRVVTRGVGLQRQRCEVELRLCRVEPGELALVEALVGEL